MNFSLEHNRTKTVITIGFSTIIIFMTVLIGLWVETVKSNEKILKEIAQTQLETRQISVMRNAAYRRALALHRMSIMDDPFDQEEEERRFRFLGGEFLATREKIFMRPMAGEEKKAWDKIRNTLNKGGRAQNQVLGLIMDNDLDKANKILLDEVVPTQDVFVEGISNILDLQTDQVALKIADVTQRNQTTYWLIGLSSTVALMLFAFTIYVVRKTGKTEEALMDQGKRIRELYKVSSSPGHNLDEQISEMLKLGNRLLGVEIARVCKINTEAETNTFLHVEAPESYGIKQGKIIPLGKSFCNITYKSDGAIALGDISNSEYANTEYHEFSGLESYIASRITVYGKEYGTVNFSSRYPHSKPFTDTDKDLVNLIGTWVSLALERKFSQSALYEAKEHAEEANKTKSDFLANMSHELRTPLNAIIGYSELLIEDVDETAETGITTDLRKIIFSGHHLLNLINDILDLSKVEAGKMEYTATKVDIHHLINYVVETFKLSLAKNNINLTVNLDKRNNFAYVDTTRLQQSLMNLIGNAVKFTKNGSINIETKQKNREGNTWTTIIIKDTGIGISQEDISKIFQPFQQASKETSIKYGGTGLVLAITHRICKMMGGDLTVVSKQDEGSTFTIWLSNDKEDTVSIDNMPKAANS
jgi:signal transduction histidine kinase/heme exporter protein D